MKTAIEKLTAANETARKAGSDLKSLVTDIRAVVLVGNASYESHQTITSVLAILLEYHLGSSETWLFRIIDPSQVSAIGAARHAKLRVDSNAESRRLSDSVVEQQTFKEERSEL